jgi:uncharacterized protein YjbI with pentapeptide repeats
VTDQVEQLLAENALLKHKIGSLEEENAALRAPTTLLGRIYGWAIHWSTIGPRIAAATENWVNEFNRTKILPARESGQLLAAVGRRYTLIVLAPLFLSLITAIFLWLGWREQQAQNRYLQRQTDLLRDQNETSARLKYAETLFAGWARTDAGEVSCGKEQRYPATLVRDYVRSYIALETARAYEITMQGSLPHGLIAASLRRACLDGLNATGEDLSGLDFTEASLKSADFNRARLADTKFVGASLQGADFFGACLRDARFHQADISGASFSGADLSRSDFTTVRGHSPGMFDKSCGTAVSLPDGRQLAPCSSVNRCR